MELVGRIEQQISAAKLPLVAITFAAVPCPDTPVILTLHWHGFVTEKIADVEGANPVRFTSVPSSALQLNEHWDDVEDLDRATLDAAWALGAWDVARAERPSCMRPGAQSREAVECLQAFGGFPFGTNAERVVVSEAPDADELISVAAKRGYLMWMFRPVHGGIWKDVADDPTLKPDGTRELPCPLEPVPPVGKGTRKTVYRLGACL
jgi:hypothetical protein